MDKPLWLWGLFLGIVLVLMVLDLGILHRKPHVLGLKESLRSGAFYVAVGVLFSVEVYFSLGGTAAQQYLTGYVLEKTLSVDNIFVMSLIFSYFAIPAVYQHRVLFWGIFGMLTLRAIMIGLGSILVHRFAWVMYVFAAFLIFSGIKMLFMREGETDIASNPVLRLLRRAVPLTPQLHGPAFFVRLPRGEGTPPVWHATPLFVALVIIECADLIFAIDSIPAVFSVTSDSYIVYTSNIFALLGLRALYFVLEALVHRFRYLKQALALVLVFIGAKTFIADALGLHEFPAGLSLSITLGLLGGGIALSQLKRPPST